MDYDEKQEHVEKLGDYDLASGCEHNGHEGLLPRIAKVLYKIDDGADETQYDWLLSLWDGRFAYVSGGHDYTGWDCQSWLDVHECASLNEALTLCPQGVRREFEDMIARRESSRCVGGLR